MNTMSLLQAFILSAMNSTYLQMAVRDLDPRATNSGVEVKLKVNPTSNVSQHSININGSFPYPIKVKVVWRSDPMTCFDMHSPYALEIQGQGHDVCDNMRTISRSQFPLSRSSSPQGQGHLKVTSYDEGMTLISPRPEYESSC